MRIESISYVKKNAAHLELDDEPIIVTQNGKPVYVIESYEERIRRDEAIALLKLLSLGEKDYRDDRVMSGEELMTSIRRKYLKE
ncbi:type II toxin-antitoxin system prevent-host-death family antitoxin [Kistimonas scapharcae]|uniref:Type II toxin-antitoxin system prevent-host-death family antitoxin n=1 Tax=Kistimonas scapharcae TaxID=1036133 RepID=A0ABP8V0U3_9GAMM